MKYTLTIDGTAEELSAILNDLSGTDNKIKKQEPFVEPEDMPAGNNDDGEDEFATLRAAVAKQSQAGKKEGVKKLLAKYKVTKLPELKPAQYKKFTDEINKL